MKTKTTTSAATDSDQSPLAVGGDIPAACQRIIAKESRDALKAGPLSLGELADNVPPQSGH
jgi:hypothetical protein